MRFSDITALVDDFLEHQALERNLARATISAYRSDLDRFVRFLVDYLGRAVTELRPADVDPRAVRAFLAHLDREGLAKSSRARMLSALRSLFRYACRVVPWRRIPRRACARPSSTSACPATCGRGRSNR